MNTVSNVSHLSDVAPSAEYSWADWHVDPVTVKSHALLVVL